MPRANRRRRDDVPLNVDRALGGLAPQRSRMPAASGSCAASPGPGASRAYLCPGCQHTIAVGTPHVVVWPADGVGGLDDRRHWHSPCWSARDRRHTQGSIR